MPSVLIWIGLFGLAVAGAIAMALVEDLRRWLKRTNARCANVEGCGRVEPQLESRTFVEPSAALRATVARLNEKGWRVELTDELDGYYASYGRPGSNVVASD